MATSSTLLRPYIGSYRNRDYFLKRGSSSSLLFFNDDYFSSCNSLWKNTTFRERLLIEHITSRLSFHERQLYQEQKARDFLSSSSSPSLVLRLNGAFRSCFDHSPPSFFKEEQQQQLPPPPPPSSSPCQLTSTENNPSILPIQQEKQSKENNCILTSNLLNNGDFHKSDLQSQSKNNMASHGHPLHSTIHSYDQRITDQENKYIIQLKTDDYQESEFQISPRYHQSQLIVDAKHLEEDSLGGYIRRELHKIFLIPKHIDLIKYNYSYNQATQELTIEMPYLQSTATDHRTEPLTFSYGDLNLTSGGKILSTRVDQPSSTLGTSTTTNDTTITNTKPFDFDLFHRSAFRPQIIQPTATNSEEKKLVMSLDLTDYQPEDIKVSVKDRELIVKAEKKVETDTRKSRTSFFQSTSLPPQTDVEHLQSNFVDGKLLIEAPYLDRRLQTTGQNPSNNDPLEHQRTETVIEFTHRRRLL